MDAGLPTARPPRGFVLVREWVIDTTHELSVLRGGLQGELSAIGVPLQEMHSVANDMVLVASELATNALKHGVPPTIVRLLRERETYLLDVADHDVSTTPRIAGGRAAGEGGFGLQIARRLALDVGWYTTETTKHVWARFPVSLPR
ncbi:ATP-binding protein [Cellulomonas aerilata]|uniref:Histidine kinase/HSP90-like ATPase domain-containing protein n=1 Tax=Cellulomonas aerilata TaxID=515326 RepID=A0A512DBI2_9CELL|nr:ATP-binding protein [Cellulomonas aerilata]GEO33841.1 hypothetical protein CAE01nite_15660 [Cellulomonas aerilata]